MKEDSLRDTFGDFLVKIGSKNSNIVVLDSDLSSSTRTYKFAKKYPDRFFNMGIAEQNMVGVALGLAISGKIPVVSGFSIFTTGRAWEFIRMACHDNLNVKIITTHGGIVGEDGSTHNALEDISLMSILPNLTVLVPSDSIELIQMLEYAFRMHGPVYIRLPRASFSNIHEENYNFLLGEPDILKEGSDYCLIGMGYGSALAVTNATIFEEELNCSIKVINLSSIKPINEERLFNEVESMKGIVVIEEHNIYCGFCSIIARILSQKQSLPMKFLAINDSFIQSGSREKLLDAYGLNITNIKDKLLELINRK
ncbi:MAG: transketolase family protein [Candidatus Hodarchaeota archaeon]